MVRILWSAFALLVLAAPLAPAQDAAWPTPDSADVQSVDAIIAAVYDVISGPKGQKRDWDRFRSLFWPDAHLIPTFHPRDSARARVTYLSVQDYIDGSGAAIEERGFFEREIGRVEERFGRIVHAFSTYESRWTADGDVFQRGMNSIQLMHDGERWWVINILWQGVGPEVVIPERYRSRN